MHTISKTKGNHVPVRIASLIDLSTYRLIDLSTYRLIDLSTYRLIDLSTYRLIDLSTYRLTDQCKSEKHSESEGIPDLSNSTNQLINQSTFISVFPSEHSS